MECIHLLLCDWIPILFYECLFIHLLMGLLEGIRLITQETLECCLNLTFPQAFLLSTFLHTSLGYCWKVLVWIKPLLLRYILRKQKGITWLASNLYFPKSTLVMESKMSLLVSLKLLHFSRYYGESNWAPFQFPLYWMVLCS